MFRHREEEEEYPLEGTTWAYPRSGFWFSHAIGIFAVGYMGYALGKNVKD